MTNLIQMGQAAKQAARALNKLTTDEKNAALHAIAEELESQAHYVLERNGIDIEAGKQKGLSSGLLDRLLLTDERISKLAADCRSVAQLPDPVGSAIDSRSLPNGLQITRRRVPIGVIGVIYEARPNVTIDIATLTLKTGNAAILRGGSETLNSNLALINIIQAALEKIGIPEAAIQYIDNPDRSLVTEFMKLDQYVDMLIPRGGHSLHKLCREVATIPVITGGIGICHVFVDETADFDDALNIIENAKVQRPSVCNALDTILVHSAVAERFIPRAAERMAQNEVALKADPRALNILDQNGHAARYEAAGPQDWDTEWMDLILGVKVVDTLDEAIEHVSEHSLDHSDSIVTNNWQNATRFVNEVNSSAVFVNASTRFNDGGQFGLGAEVAVSTQKLHARGPMGLEELTTYKWVVLGDGHIRG